MKQTVGRLLFLLALVSATLLFLWTKKPTGGELESPAEVQAGESTSSAKIYSTWQSSERSNQQERFSDSQSAGPGIVGDGAECAEWGVLFHVLAIEGASGLNDYCFRLYRGGAQQEKGDILTIHRSVSPTVTRDGAYSYQTGGPSQMQTAGGTEDLGPSRSCLYKAEGNNQEGGDARAGSHSDGPSIIGGSIRPCEKEQNRDLRRYSVLLGVAYHIEKFARVLQSKTAPLPGLLKLIWNTMKRRAESFRKEAREQAEKLKLFVRHVWTGTKALIQEARAAVQATAGLYSKQ